MLKEKNSLEFHAAQLFADLYSRSHGTKLKFVELHKPPEPDALCELGGEKLGIEIVHIYGTETDAKRVLNRKLREPLGEEELMANRLCSLEQKIPFALSQVIYSKAAKSYLGDRLWLVIRNAFPLWYKDDFVRYLERISLPTIHHFEQIWLVCDARGKSGLLRIY